MTTTTTPGITALTHPSSMRPRVTPAVDVFETPESYVLTIDLPGVAREGITLTMEQGMLTLKAEAAPLHTPDARILYRELAAPVYERSFTIGDGVDQGNIDARYDSGVLAVKLYKKEERKPREISIQ